MAKRSVDFVKIGDLELSDPYPYDEKEPLEEYTATLRKGSMHACTAVQAPVGRDIITQLRWILEGTLNTGALSSSAPLEVSLHRDKDAIAVRVALRHSAEKWKVESQFKLGQDDLERVMRQLTRFFREGVAANK